MKLIRSILLAQDFGMYSEKILEVAVGIAKVFQSEVTPIHVLPDDLENEKVKLLLHDAVEKKLKESIDYLVSKGVSIKEPILAYGPPSSVIVKAAIDIEANLILTGSGEKKRGDKFLLGTTTERIIQRSDKPVLVVKQGDNFNVDHILCPVDFSMTSKRALENAIYIARLLKAKLTVLSVCELHTSAWFGSEKSKVLENESRRTGHQEKFDKFLGDFDLSELENRTEILFGDPSKEILKTISAQKVDLLVIGAAGKSGINRLFIGSVAKKVVREVPCSFMTLKTENVISMQLEKNIRDIESHFIKAEEFAEEGSLEEAIRRYKICLTINNMHVPSYYGLAKIYEKLKDHESAKLYRRRGSEILDRTWDQKIEEGAWKFKSC
jgi:nucleotide-binding universal stress UspA family protein